MARSLYFGLLLLCFSISGVIGADTPAPADASTPTPATTAAEAELERAKAVLAAQNGVVSGSLNPAKRGIQLPSAPKVMIIPVYDENSRYGMIDDWMAGFIERRLEDAKKEKYDLVILEIDTFGGSVPACERINRAIANSPVPVVALVVEKAFSGGALISLGCKMIVMTPQSQIGGAKTVTPFGNIPSDMRPKIEAEARARVLGLARANNYPSAIAVGMVNEDPEVWETNDPNERFMLLEDLEAAERRAAPPARVKLWKPKGAILSLTEVEARNAGLSSGTVADLDELYIGLNIRPASIVRAEITTTEVVARFLSHPGWRVLIVLVGLIGLFLELKSPGHGVGFVVFGFCLGLFFWLQIFAATAGLMEILLFGFGAILLAVEFFILPGFGFVGFAGFACVLVSIILSFLPQGGISKAFDGSATSGDRESLGLGLNYSLLTLTLVIGSVVIALWKGAKLPGLNRLALQTEIPGATVAVPEAEPAAPIVAIGAKTGQERKPDLKELVGKRGTAETVLRPGGKVRIDGRTYDALCQGGFVDPGKNVVVVRATSSELVVREEA